MLEQGVEASLLLDCGWWHEREIETALVALIEARLGQAGLECEHCNLSFNRIIGLQSSC